MRLWIATLLFVVGFAEVEFGMFEARRESRISQTLGSDQALAEGPGGFPPK
jgi:hypothetical protein